MTARVQEFNGVRELSMEEVAAVFGGEQVQCTVDEGTVTCSCPEGSSMTITETDDGISITCEPATS